MSFISQHPPGEGPEDGGCAPALRMIEEEPKPIPSKDWAAMIRKVYEVDLVVCPHGSGWMKVIPLITDSRTVDKIIDHT